MAQSNGRDGSEYPFLLELTRVYGRSNRCVLVSRDGAYHYERDHGNKTQVLEGTLSSADLSLINRWTSDQALARLTQREIPQQLIPIADTFRVSIFRGDHWQYLFFPDEDSRKPFKQALKPILAWLDDVSKHPAKELTEDEGKNHCVPPSDNLRFSARGAPVVAGPKQPTQSSAVTSPVAGSVSSKAPSESHAPSGILLRVLTNYSFMRVAVRNCASVYSSGLFHNESSSQEVGRPMESQIFEGSLAPSEVEALRQQLENPELENAPVKRAVSDIPFGRGGETRLWITRPDHVQDLTFAILPNRSRGGEDLPAQYSDARLLRPILTLLKTDFEAKKLKPVSKGVPNGCAPQP